MIEPTGQTRTDALSSGMVFFIQRMPNTKLVNQVTIGDVSLGPGCSGTSAYKLFVRQHPLGQMGTQSSSSDWQADSVDLTNQSSTVQLTTTPQRVTFLIEPTTFLESKGYSFWIDDVGPCSSVSVRSWPHSSSQINAGVERCDRVASSNYRMWHVQGQSDALPCGSPSVTPDKFDPSHPTGWMSVPSPYSPTVEIVSDWRTDPPSKCLYDGYGVEKVFWRVRPTNSGWKEYVCIWRQFPDFQTMDPEQGWFYGFGWADARPGGPRDVYLELGLDDSLAAGRYKPFLQFDSSEKWRPLSVNSLLSEQAAGGGPAHQACTWTEFPSGTAADVCASVVSPDNLAINYPSETSHLDLAGAIPDESSYATPNATCLVGGLLDCNSGSTSTLYYRVTPASGSNPYRFIQYWAFYRFNSWSDSTDVGSHEGDWEGYAVAPSHERPGTFDYASFTSHGPWFNYLRSSLRCTDGSYNGECGSESAKLGARVRVYVANGSHASYPRVCSETIAYVSCDRASSGFSERGYDGSRSWGNNGASYDHSPAGLSALPDAPDAWTQWNGRWGAADSPRSPGRQPTYDVSWGDCAHDDENCARPATVLATSNSASLSRAASSCGNWFGPGVSAIICEPTRLRHAVKRKALGNQDSHGTSVAMVNASRRDQMTAATGRGLVQIVGPPLRSGDRINLGRRVRDGEVRMRIQTRGKIVDVVFPSVTLKRGTKLTLHVAGRKIHAQAGTTRWRGHPTLTRDQSGAQPTRTRTP